METGDREAFLARLRSRVETDGQISPSRPIRSWDGKVPAIAYRDLSSGTARFSQALEAVAGHARVLSGEHDLRALLEEIRRAHYVRKAVISRDPECEGIADMLRNLGIETDALTSPDQAAAADLGITGAAFGIALTGSILVDAARAGGRSASLLPPIHLALLRADRIVATPGAVLRALPQHPAGLSSNLVLITGPSRSADIELQLTLGVHGPREVWVAILDEQTADRRPDRA